jgi:predicted dehydrogenase
MGAIHARILAQLDEFDLVAVCDLDELTAQKVAAETGAPRIYTDYATMLKRERPEVVAIATPTALHAAMTFQAIEAGVRGICCEKPMATNLADGREMLERCREKGIAFIVNHQRRMGADLVAMREAVGRGDIGELLAIRAHCAGDLLSDGTHAVDSALWLLGDSEAEWVIAQIHRQLSPSFSGFRYGHPVESGAMVLVRFTNGVRLELFTSDLRDPLRAY